MSPLSRILILGGLLRFFYFLLVWYLNPQGFWSVDSGDYWRLASGLLNSGDYTQSSGDSANPEHYRLPLYPILLAGLRFLGLGLYAGVLLNVVFGLATIYFTYKAAFLFGFKERAALIAAAFIALDIPSVIFGNYLLSEALFTLLLLLSIYQLMQFLIREGRNQYLLFSAFFLGVAMLTRPVAFYLPWLILLVLLLNSGEQSFKIRVRSAAIYLAVCLVAISPWLIRNQFAFGKTFYSTSGDFMLAAWHAPNVVAQKENIPVSVARYQLWEKWYYGAPVDAYQEPLAYSGYIRQRSLEIMAANPDLVVRQQVQGIAFLMLKPARGQLLHQLLAEANYEPATAQQGLNLDEAFSKVKSAGFPLMALVALQWILLGLLYLGCLFGFYLLWIKWPRILFLLFFLLIAYLVNMIVPPITYSRFRVPVMPILAMLAGIGLDEMLKKWNRRKV